MPRKEDTALVNGKAFPVRATATVATARPILIALPAEVIVVIAMDFTVRADFEATAVIKPAAPAATEPNFDLAAETTIVELVVLP